MVSLVYHLSYHVKYLGIYHLPYHGVCHGIYHHLYHGIWYIPSFIPWYIPWGHNTQRTCAVTGGCAAFESRRGGASESAYPSRVLGWGGADPDGDSDERPGRWARQGSATRRDAAATRMMRRLGCGGDSDDGGGDAAAAAARIRITELTPGPAGPPAGPGPGRSIRHPGPQCTATA